MKKNENFLNMLRHETPKFLPMSMKELNGLGYDRPDFVLVTGDAYVDHPSFGAALIGKLLWAAGFSVGIIAQPDVNKPESFKAFGEPFLGFLVTSGNVDSMVNNYTAAKKPRSNDYYSPGGKAGKRPDRALTVYSRKIREIYGDEAAIVLGGLEASLRRFSHYDYWANSVRKPILVDSQADLLIYGMGERALLETAALLSKGLKARDITNVEGTVYGAENITKKDGVVELPRHEVVAKDRTAYADSFKTQIESVGKKGAVLAEKCGKRFIMQNPPAQMLTTREMDAVYAIGFEREAHPSYKLEIPAIQEVRFSITAVRGCLGSCNFCALAFHQGRGVVSRSEESIVKEATLITGLNGFKGYIHDIGGPTANFYGISCKVNGSCTNKKCLTPEICKNINTSHSAFLGVLRAVRKISGVKKAFVRSGIRYDFLLKDTSSKFLDELCEHHISGQLKIAPEHISDTVLKQMGKPNKAVYERFLEKYRQTNSKVKKNQFVVPYLMSGHPGSGLKEAIALAEYLRDNNIAPEQVQDFYPTPGTVSTCIYHTGINPLTGEKVFTAKTPHEKAMQRALIQYKLPQNYKLVYDALRQSGRLDLIGYSKKCLIRPQKVNSKFNKN